MAKQAVKARPAGAEKATGAEKAKGAEKSGAKEGFERERDVTWGYVDSYSVNAERLMIKLNTGAIGRQLVMLPADAPHFRTGVSMTMMAYHTPKTKMTVRFERPQGRPRNDLDIVVAVEIGIGLDPEKTLYFDDWKTPEQFRL